MPPLIKTDPDLVDDERWTYARGLGRIRSGPRPPGYWQSRSFHEEIADYYQVNPDGHFIAQESHPDTCRDRFPPSRNDRASNTPMSYGRLASNFGHRNENATNASSNFETLANNLGAFLTDRERRREPFGYTSEEYARRRYNYRHADGDIEIKREEDEISLFFKDSRRSDPSKAAERPSITTTRGSSHRTISIEVGSGNNSFVSPPPPPPSPSQPIHRISSDCTCPIDLHCNEKQDHEIDCRPLVPESKQWEQINNGLDPEEYTSQLVLSLLSLIPSRIPWAEDGDEEEIFTNLNELTLIIELCNDVEQMPPSQQRITQMWRWTRIHQHASVRGGDIARSNVIPRLETFLDPQNAALLNRKRVPKDLREDMLVLLRKWRRGDFDARPNRGLRRADGRGQWRVDPNWPWRLVASFFGHGPLVNGQTWLNRAAMMRDGVHGMRIAGIYGTKGNGVYAVVMGLHLPKHKYADVDYGQIAYYIGTSRSAEPGSGKTNTKDTEEDQIEWADQEATNGTQALMKSHETGEPIRMIRSYKASPIVPGRPKHCYRYDGLYKVVDYECLKAQRQIYRFTMERLPEDDVGQGPLRGWRKVDQDERAQKNRQTRERQGRRNYGRAGSVTSPRARSEDGGRRVKQKTSYR